MYWAADSCWDPNSMTTRFQWMTDWAIDSDPDVDDDSIPMDHRRSLGWLDDEWMIDHNRRT